MIYSDKVIHAINEILMTPSSIHTHRYAAITSDEQTQIGATSPISTEGSQAYGHCPISGLPVDPSKNKVMWVETGSNGSLLLGQDDKHFVPYRAKSLKKWIIRQLRNRNISEVTDPLTNRPLCSLRMCLSDPTSWPQVSKVDQTRIVERRSSIQRHLTPERLAQRRYQLHRNINDLSMLLGFIMFQGGLISLTVLSIPGALTFSICALTIGSLTMIGSAIVKWLSNRDDQH